MDDIITLIASRYDMDEINQQIAVTTERDVWCFVTSASRAEWNSAAVRGLQPELVVTTPACNYDGELAAIYHGVRYSIYRTYRQNDTDEIELYLSREVGS